MFIFKMFQRFFRYLDSLLVIIPPCEPHRTVFWPGTSPSTIAEYIKSHDFQIHRIEASPGFWMRLFDKAGNSVQWQLTETNLKDWKLRQLADVLIQVDAELGLRDELRKEIEEFLSPGPTLSYKVVAIKETEEDAKMLAEVEKFVDEEEAKWHRS